MYFFPKFVDITMIYFEQHLSMMVFSSWVIAGVRAVYTVGVNSSPSVVSTWGSNDRSVITRSDHIGGGGVFCPVRFSSISSWGVYTYIWCETSYKCDRCMYFQRQRVFYFILQPPCEIFHRCETIPFCFCDFAVGGLMRCYYMEFLDLFCYNLCCIDWLLNVWGLGEFLYLILGNNYSTSHKWDYWLSLVFFGGKMRMPTDSTYRFNNLTPLILASFVQSATHNQR